ncbi:MAG TPA: chaperone modulator CbpM [Ferruginibacter sp.]|nr:chaperone modulator CbpM [Ferruginibacter sp.]
MANIKLVAAKTFCSHHNISYEFISQLQQNDLIEVVKENRTYYIPYEQLEKLEKMVRLYRDLDINPEGIQTVIYLLEQLHEKEKEIIRLRNRLVFYKDAAY